MRPTAAGKERKMEQPKQMGSERAEPREGAQIQQQGSQQQGSQQQPVQRRDGDKPQAGQMQGTQFRDWASI